MLEINLIPDYLREKKEKNKRIKNKCKVIVVALILLFFSLLSPYNELIKLRKIERTYLSSYNTDIKEIDEKINMISKEIYRYKQYINKVNSIISSKSNILTKIEEIRKYAPADVSFTSLIYNSGEIKIKAICESYYSINEIAVKLEASKLYRDVRINEIKANNVEDAKNKKIYQFVLTVLVN